MELDSRKKSRRDRMMRLENFETHEVREIDRKEAGESRGFLILCMGIMEDVFQMERKECIDQERLKMCWRKSTPERGRCFSMGWATLSGPVAVDEERFVAAARSSAGGEGGPKERMRLLRALGSAKLGKTASGSAMQGLLRNSICWS